MPSTSQFKQLIIMFQFPFVSAVQCILLVSVNTGKIVVFSALLGNGHQLSVLLQDISSFILHLTGTASFRGL